MRNAGHSRRQHRPARATVNAQHSSNTAPEPCVALTDDWRRPLLRADQLRGRRGVAVAIGKFDAMHTGHRALAEATAALDCFPCLLSFWGMAEVLNLTPRQPLVADAERPRILRSWAPACGGIAPIQRSIPFANIRQMEPEAFVALLARELQVKGVVVGANFRFGYKARGDVALLQREGAKHGLQVRVLQLCAPGESATSSSHDSSASSSDTNADAASAGVAQGDGMSTPSNTAAPPPASAVIASDDAAASSTAVRKLVLAGRVAEAQQYLDRHYAVLVPLAVLHSRAGNMAQADSSAPHTTAEAHSFDFHPSNVMNQLPKTGQYIVQAACDTTEGLQEQRRVHGTLRVAEAVCLLELQAELELIGEFVRIEMLGTRNNST